MFYLVSCSFVFAKDEMTSSLLIGNARIDIMIEGGTLRMPAKDLFLWVKSAAESATAYYGRFPVPQVLIRIALFEGRGVRNGMTFGDRGGRITIRLGNETVPAELASDWMLTHEMVHLAFPSVDEDHHWIEEGIATYVEPIARIQAGHLKAEQMWLDLVRDMPQGLPEVGDRGLDHTHTWGRTYWGGALFCLLADVEIRRQTSNARGLEHALRGILDDGGDIRKDWSLEDALRAGDRAVGVNVLHPLYTRMKDKPVTVDLDSLWTQLGVRSDGASVRFDDNATLAPIRRAITTALESNAVAEDSLPSGPTAVFAGRAVGALRNAFPRILAQGPPLQDVGGIGWHTQEGIATFGAAGNSRGLSLYATEDWSAEA
jgi:hypothetical protein